jgi:hypothetical protein
MFCTVSSSLSHYLNQNKKKKKKVFPQLSFLPHTFFYFIYVVENSVVDPDP